MKTAERPVFRLRSLLNPFYLVRRLREMRSFDELRLTVANVFILVGARSRNAYYELRGVPRLIAARSANAYYALRGVPRLVAARGEAAYYTARGFPKYLKARAEKAYYKVDPPGLLARGAAPAPVGTAKAAGGREVLHPDLRAKMHALSEQFQAATPFKHVVIDGLLDPEFCRALTAEFPPYEAAAFRNEHGHLGKAHHEKVSQLAAPFRKLDQYLQTPEFLRLASDLTGIPDLLYDPEYLGGGAHENLEEMELDPHVDFTIHKTTGLHRRVNLLLYLNPEWEESWGGGLELHVNPWLPPDKNPIRVIAPVFNRCVLFETNDHSWHGFRPIRLPPDKKGVTRKSFALYLYTREKPGGFPSIPHDLTVFVDRPLPADIRPGLALNEQNFRVLRHLIVRRDWKLRHLYNRAIALFNESQRHQAALRVTQAALQHSDAQKAALAVELQEALARAEAEKAAVVNDLRLSRSQLRESLEALLRARAAADKPPA